MISLPIVDRELRVAARKRSTFWTRIAAALTAFVIGVGFLILSVAGVLPFGSAALGRALFAVLTWFSLAAALSAGLFFTSDCLSEEKREGTLGFLFLTDLSGHDVVLGKLLATSLRSFYALIAVLPVLAITLLMGGVAGAQFGKTAVALVSASLLSLAAGLFVSAISHESQNSMKGTLGLLFLLAAAGPAIDAALSTRGITAAASLSSPVYLFTSASGLGGGQFWSALVTNQIIAGTLLGAAGLLLPRTWQDSGRSLVPAGSWRHRWKYGGKLKRAALRQKLLAAHPVAWLVCREQRQAFFLWVLSIGVVVGFAALLNGANRAAFWPLWTNVGGMLVLVFYLTIASQSARLFVEARRTGLLELLLSTPLRASDVVRGYWRALLRMFGLPVALCLGAQFAGTVLSQRMMLNQFSAATTTAAPATNSPAGATNVTVVTNVIVASAGATTIAVVPGTSTRTMWVAPFIALLGVLTVAANFTALCWVSMWMGLVSRSTNAATLRALVFVQIVPWFAVTFVSYLLVALLIPVLGRRGSLAPANIVLGYTLLSSGVATLLYVAKDVAFSWWARQKLSAEFHERVLAFSSPPSVRPPHG